MELMYKFEIYSISASKTIGAKLFLDKATNEYFWESYAKDTEDNLLLQNINTRSKSLTVVKDEWFRYMAAAINDSVDDDLA